MGTTAFRFLGPLFFLLFCACGLIQPPVRPDPNLLRCYEIEADLPSSYSDSLGYEIPQVVRLEFSAEGQWRQERLGTLSVAQKHQIGNFADFCNECGNCDIFCPEDGGPYVLKPRFFGTQAAWEIFPHHDGFYVQRDQDVRSLTRERTRHRHVVSEPAQHPRPAQRGHPIAGSRPGRCRSDQQDPHAQVRKPVQMSRRSGVWKFR